MMRLFQYYGKYQGLRTRLGAMPGWAKFIVGIFAIPGILIFLLSILLFLVSILALLLLTVPVYRLLQWLTARPVETTRVVVEEEPDIEPDRPRKPVEVTIIE
jgi:hypothetical protein